MNKLTILFAFISFAAFGQTQQREPEYWAKPRWNTAEFWQSPTYLQSPDKRFLDWANYTVSWDGKQWTLFAVAALSGIAHGMRERYHADPYIFEKRWGVSSTSFWGSDAWKRNYKNNDPEQAHKHEYLGNIGRDAWHTLDEVSLLCITTPITMTAFRKAPRKYRVANSIACLGVRTLFAFATYKSL